MIGALVIIVVSSVAVTSVLVSATAIALASAGLFPPITMKIFGKLHTFARYAKKKPDTVQFHNLMPGVASSTYATVTAFVVVLQVTCSPVETASTRSVGHMSEFKI